MIQIGIKKRFIKNKHEIVCNAKFKWIKRKTLFQTEEVKMENYISLILDGPPPQCQNSNELNYTSMNISFEITKKKCFGFFVL